MLVSILLALAFMLLRFNNWGDYHDLPGKSLVDYLNFTKYPASIVYQLFSLAIFFFILSIAMAFPRLVAIFSVYGRATLFFYVTHIYLYGIAGYLFPHGGSWSWVVIVWLIGLLMLYPACRYWTAFKKNNKRGVLKYL
jgi:hypothetical protein